ncbi:MAG: protein kinase [Pseudomonadota bacterium]
MAGVLNEGQRLGNRFILRQRLGGGHHGSAVWLAEDLQAARPVALKLLGHPADPAQRRALLEHERSAMARVQHNAVACALEVIEAQGESFLVMDAVLGQGGGGSGALAGARPRELSSLRGAPGEDWIRPVLQLASALTAVHAAGVVHRDVKASNVLIDAQGNALLIDFGVAAIVRDAPPEQALRSGGSPLAMSPQQRAGEAPSVADDIYAFGVLLHELAFGRAPVEGNTVDAVGSSAGLSDLIRRCLQEAPSKRPADMKLVANILAQVASADFNATRAPLALSAVKAAEFIDPTPVRSVARVGATAAAAGKSAKAGGGVPWRLLGAVSAVWLLVLSGVVLSLLSPRVDVPATASRSPAPSVAERGEPSRAESSIAAPMEFARLRRERDAMLDDVNEVLDLRSALEARAVVEWGEERYAQAIALGVRGDELFRANDFVASAEAYGQARELFEALQDKAPEVAASRVQDGWAAYEAGKAAESIVAFEQALAIDDSLRDARNGLARARQLDEVLALSTEAQELERSGALRDAAGAYEQVLALDSDREDARAALANLRLRLDRSSFDQRMSEGFAALSAGDFSAARRAFEAAGRLDPDASVVRDALAQVDVDSRGRQLSSLGAKAEQLVAQERWREALAVYDEALAIDPSLRFAREGREVAARLSELYEQLTFYADDPQRLADNSILKRATRVLESARQTTPRGPQLEERQARLAQAIDEVRQPVLMRIASDNRTNVRILRVADLGRFQQTELQLRPGRYTVIGTRDGYRDVREEFTVTVGGQSQVIDVRCVEKI